MVLKYAMIIFLMLILLALCFTDPIYEYTMKKYDEIIDEENMRKKMYDEMMNEEKGKNNTESKGD